MLRSLVSRMSRYFVLRITTATRPTYSRDSLYYRHKEQARMLVHQKLEHWNKFYNFSYQRVAIRNQRTRWGSCSSKGNLNFNYRIVFLPEPLQDYLIVHELCHLQEFNHSRAFWDLVEQTIPEYRKHRLLMKKYRVR